MISLDLFSYSLQIPIWVVLILAVAVTVLGAGRVTRVIYHDAFPPSIWFRLQWDKLTANSSWNLLFHCPWCLSHWVVAVAIVWFLVGIPVAWLGFAWWLFWGWFAISYLTAMVIVRDEPADSE